MGDENGESSEMKSAVFSIKYWAIIALLAVYMFLLSIISYLATLRWFPSEGVGVASVVFNAGMMLLLVIAYIGLVDTQQNQLEKIEDQVEVQKQHSEIIKESEWMPEVYFGWHNDPPGIFFIGHRPWYPEFRIFPDDGAEHPLEFDSTDTEWIEENIGPADGNWFARLPEEIIDDIVQFGDGTVFIQLKFESTTGAIYLYEFEVLVEVSEEEDTGSRFKAEGTPSLKRKLPWELD